MYEVSSLKSMLLINHLLNASFVVIVLLLFNASWNVVLFNVFITSVIKQPASIITLKWVGINFNELSWFSLLSPPSPPLLLSLSYYKELQNKAL